MQLLLYPSNDAFVSYTFSTSRPPADHEWLFPQYMRAKDIVYCCYLRCFRPTKRVFCHQAQLPDASRIDIDWETISSKKLKKSSSKLSVLDVNNSSVIPCDSTSIIGKDITLPINCNLLRSFFEALWNSSISSNDSFYNLEDCISVRFCTNVKEKKSHILKFRQHHYRFFWNIISYLHEPSIILALFSDLAVVAEISEPVDENSSSQRNAKERPLPTEDDEDFDIDAIVESAITHFIQTDDFGPDTVSPRMKEKRRNASSTIDMSTLGNKDVYQSASAKMAKLEELKGKRDEDSDKKTTDPEQKQERGGETPEEKAKSTNGNADASETLTHTDVKNAQQTGSDKKSSPRRMASAEIDISKIDLPPTTSEVSPVSQEEPTKTMTSPSSTTKASPRRLASAEIDISHLSQCSTREDSAKDGKEKEALSSETKKSPRRMASADIGTAELDRLTKSGTDDGDKSKGDDESSKVEESMTGNSNYSANNPQSGAANGTEQDADDGVKPDDEGIKRGAEKTEQPKVDSTPITKDALYLDSPDSARVHPVDADAVKKNSSTPQVVHNTLKNILDVLADLPLLKHIHKVTSRFYVLYL